MTIMSDASCTTHSSSVLIREHALTLTLLVYLVDMADQGKPEILETAQQLGKDLDRLRQMSLSDLLRVTDQRLPIFELHVNSSSLRYSMMRQRTQSANESELEWFMRQQAPSALMLRLFGMNAASYRQYRAMYGIDGRPGRPRRIDTKTETKLLKDWRSFNRLDLKDRYRAVAEVNPDLGLDSIHALLEKELRQ